MLHATTEIVQAQFFVCKMNISRFALLEGLGEKDAESEMLFADNNDRILFLLAYSGFCLQWSNAEMLLTEDKNTAQVPSALVP